MQELPFAVEATSSLHQSSGSSLVTASSGSLDSSPLPPNTPQDVVLPTSATRYDDIRYPSHPQHHHQPRISSGGGHLLTPAADGGGVRDHHIVRKQQQQQQHSGVSIVTEPDIIDFTYVDVCETDEDEVTILLDGGLGTQNLQQETHRGDILAVILSGMQNDENERLVNETTVANKAAAKASEAKKNGDLIDALEYHSQASKLYRNIGVALRERNASLSNSMFLLSQGQAKSALALKNIVKLSPAELQQVLPSNSSDVSDNSATHSSSATSKLTQKDRLRAAVRGALGSRHPHEADISDSQFLGSAASESSSSKEQNHFTHPDSSGLAESVREIERSSQEKGTLLSDGHEPNHNPVDEMMELERELRDMDMTLELGNSISSLDTRMQHRMKNSIVDGSFMVVPPGSNSYMSSSAMWGSIGHIPSNSRPSTQTTNNSGTAGVRARANRVVQNNKRGGTAAASASGPNRHLIPPSHTETMSPTKNNNNTGLESSWWGNASTASQILTSSVIAVGGRTGTEMGQNSGDTGHHHQANTKSLMRLMDSLKTLGDENAALLREVEEAEVARQEAKAAREQMKRFKTEYGKKFAVLKSALEKFRREHPHGNSSEANPVATSEFSRKASVTDQLQRQEQLIRKLTSDLKHEKEESKKKDAALRKYESFYREVKARSAQKAAQRQMENQQRHHKSRNSSRAIR